MNSSINNIEYGGITSATYSPLNTFKHTSILGYVNVPEENNIEQIIKVSCNCNILEKKLIKTPRGTSFDGQCLTGFSLILNCIIKGKIDYIGSSSLQNYSTHNFYIPFSTDILVPESYVSGGNYIINTFINDIHCRKVNNCKLLLNLSVLLDYENY